MSLETLHKTIKTTQELREIVSNMKSLSSVSINQYEQAGKVLEKYRRNLKEAFHALAVTGKLPHFHFNKNTVTRHLFIVIGSDNGMVGRYNKELLDLLKSYLKKQHINKKDSLFVIVGKRLAILAEQADFPLWICYGISNSLKNVISLSENLILKIDEATAKEHISNVNVLYHQRRNSSVTLENRSILPLDIERLHNLRRKKWETNNIPQIGGNALQMFNALTNESLLITLAKQLNASLAAEHYTRMTNMQNAEKNIDENLAELNLQYQQQRQEDITEELIDVISGAEALRKK